MIKSINFLGKAKASVLGISYELCLCERRNRIIDYLNDFGGLLDD